MSTEIEVPADPVDRPSGPSAHVGQLGDRPGEARCEFCLRRPQALCAHCHALMCAAHDGVFWPAGLSRTGAWWSRRRRERSLLRAQHLASPRGGRAARRDRDRRPVAKESAFRSGRPTSSAGAAAFGTRSRGAGAPKGAGRQVPPRPGTTAAESLEERQFRPPTEAAQRTEVHLCPDCLPLDRWSAPEMVAATTTGLLGLAVLGDAAASDGGNPWVGYGVGAVVVIAGLVRLAARRHHARRTERSTSDLALPVRRDPIVTELRHVERVHRTLRLRADRSYERKSGQVTGRVEIDAIWSASPDGDLSASAAPVRAGHVLVRGPADVVFRDGAGLKHRHPLAVSLAPRPADHAALTSSSVGHDARWSISLPYDIGERGRAAADRLSVDVTPSLVPGLQLRGLDLDISWSAVGPRRYQDGPILERLDVVEVTVPRLWGRVEPSGSASVSLGRATQTVRWDIVAVEGRARGRAPLTLRFAEKMTFDEHSISVRVEARFRGAVSGTHGMTLFYAGGAPRPEFCDPTGASRNAVSRTVVVVEAELDLRGLRYQEIRHVPDRIRAEDYGTDIRFAGVAPSHDVVTRLCDELGDRDYFVKRVIENAPQMGRGRTVARSWDIGGRLYLGVYPIDFDLAVTGEEPQAGTGAAAWTLVKLDVSGAYANEVMRLRVGRERDNLWNLVRRTLEALADSVVPEPREEDGDVTDPSEESLGLGSPREQRDLSDPADDGGPDYTRRELFRVIETARRRGHLSSEQCRRVRRDISVTLGTSAGDE